MPTGRRAAHGRGQPAGAVAWHYQIAGQGERAWLVLRSSAYDCLCAVGLRRWHTRPARYFRENRGCIQFSARSTSIGNSRALSVRMTCQSDPCRPWACSGQHGAWFTARSLANRPRCTQNNKQQQIHHTHHGLTIAWNHTTGPRRDGISRPADSRSGTRRWGRGSGGTDRGERTRRVGERTGPRELQDIEGRSRQQNLVNRVH